MAGYNRQSVADITANAVIKAAPVNAEYNALRDAFAFATGHKHDGSSTEGAYVPLIADVDALNKVVIDTTNNRISFYAQVGAGTVEQLRIQDGAIVPVTDSDVDLGSSSAEFKDLYIDGIGYIDTIAVHENATIAGTLGVTGLSTLATVDINGGNIDGTIIGGATPAAATITSLVATTADINGGTIDGVAVAGSTVNSSQIGNTSASTITGTTVNATNFVGPLAGNVTGNLTGNTAGVHTGAVTGNVTGNITAGSGTSSFTNVTINGSLDMNSGTASTITGLSNPVQGSDAATKTYVDQEVTAVIASAPGALDTLNELAAALGDDANYASTTTAAIATKLPKAGGTMTGAIAMGTSKITGLGTPTAGTDAVTKTYTDTADALKVTKAGDTMSGVLAMGANKITGVADPTLAQDATTKTYVDTILGSSTAAATSAGNAATSETNAANSATAAATSYDSFDDRMLGSKSSAPSVDNDGGSLLTGAMYWDTTASAMKVYSGSAWVVMAPNAADQALINAVGGEIVYTEDLGSIASAVSTGSGNSIGVVGAAITNVNTVAGAISNVNAAASNATNINSAVANATNINSVAGSISNVNAVASNATNINSAVANATNINSVVSNATNVNTVATNISDVNAFVNKYRTASSAPSTSLDSGDLWWNTSANELRAYNTATSTWAATAPTALNQAAIDIVAGDIVYSEDLGAITAAVTVGTGSGQIAAVGNAISNVNSVASNISNVNAVGAISANITTVSNNSSNISTVAGITSNIGTVAGAVTNVNLVGAAIANVNSVASNLADVNRYANEYKIASTAPSSPSTGDLWMDTTTNIFKYFNGTIFSSIISGLTNIHEDVTPQLGGALDGQNNNMTNIGTISGSNLQLDFGGL